MSEQLLNILASYGAPGLFCGYLAYRDWCRDKREEKRADRIEKIMEDRAGADKDLAVAMTILGERLR